MMIAYFTRFLILLACTCSFVNLASQDFLLNNPYIINYNKKQYQGGTENWQIASSKDGYIYVANNEGMLKYDGKTWNLYKLPNKTIVRSLALDEKNARIYVGGQDEVGYFQSAKNGTLEYKSLKSLLPNPFKSIEDVWDIQVSGANIIFRSVNSIFVYDGKSIKSLNIPSKEINFLKSFHETIYWGDPTQGLFTDKDGIPSFVKGSEIFKGNRVSNVISLPGNKILFITERSGGFVLHNDKFTTFFANPSKNASILNSSVFLDSLIVISSVLDGLLFFDLQGRYLYSITKKQGLQTNSIICITKDINGNLWTGTTNGINQIMTNSPYSIIYPDLELEGGVYAIQIYKDKLYVGTNNGLFYTPWNDENSNIYTSKFVKVPRTEGQVWSLDIVQGDLFMGHNQGLYQIYENAAIKISKDYTGTWRCLPLPDTSLMIAGTYTGFQLFKKKKPHQWDYLKNITGFVESARIVVKDNTNIIWVSHPYRGVYKIELDKTFYHIKNVKRYGQKNGLPSDLANYVTLMKGQIYVNGEKGVFTYDKGKDGFDKDTLMEKMLGKDVTTRRFFPSSQASMWYVNENDCGFISQRNQKLTTPFLKDKLLGGFENIYIPNEQNAFVATDKGLILVDMLKLQRKDSLHIKFYEIVNFGVSSHIVYGGHNAIDDEKSEFPINQNNVKFSFGTNQLDPTLPIQYSYRLKGEDKNWSSWTEESYKSYENLNPGQYTFEVKAKQQNGVESHPVAYSFTVLPPWYLSKWAFLIYVLAFGLGIQTLIKFLDKKHESEKLLLKQDKKESEAMVQDLLSDKLQSEIDFKTKELALSTMHIVQKNETLTKLRDELNTITKQSKDGETKTQIKKVISLLSDDNRLEDDWESFAVHFDKVHTDFLRRLKGSYPLLSPKDLKLCAYLRMNLTTKDIAPLLNISVRGVEISRYRLRKKLNLDNETNMTEFMMNF